MRNLHTTEGKVSRKGPATDPSHRDSENDPSVRALRALTAGLPIPPSQSLFQPWHTSVAYLHLTARFSDAPVYPDTCQKQLYVTELQPCCNSEDLLFRFLLTGRTCLITRRFLYTPRNVFRLQYKSVQAFRNSLWNIRVSKLSETPFGIAVNTPRKSRKKLNQK